MLYEMIFQQLRVIELSRTVKQKKRTLAMGLLLSMDCVVCQMEVFTNPLLKVQPLQSDSTSDTNAARQNGGIGISTSAALTDLTGVWNCDDGGIYYIRQLGNQIWRYGEKDPDTPEWSNVMYGTINGDIIDGNWADVSKGWVMQNGLMAVKIESNNRLSIIQKTAGIAGSVWTRGSSVSNIDKVSATPMPLPGPKSDLARATPMPLPGPTDFNYIDNQAIVRE